MKKLWTRGSVLFGLWLCALFVVSASSANGQPFTTVINVPPDPDPGLIGSDTQLNLFDGGSLGDQFFVGDKFVPASNMEVNISGGQVGRQFLAFSGSTVNLSGGAIGDDFTAFPGSTVNLSGGSVGYRFGVTGTLNMSGGFIDKDFRPGTDSTIDISGGTIAEGGSFGGFTVGFNSTVNISGGVLPKFTAFSSDVNISGGNMGEITNTSGSVLTVFGGEFEVDGVPVPGLNSIGDSVTLTATSGISDLLTGTLTDGAVFTNTFFEVTLVATALPTKSSEINTPTDPAPLGLRSGQTLNLSAGGALNNHFAAVNANLNMAGGTIGVGFESVGSDISITGGSIGDNFTARSGGTVNINGGEIGDFFYAFDGVAVNISGGALGNGFIIRPGITVDISGGTVGKRFNVQSGSTVSMSGGELKLDGEIVPGLGSVGDSVSLNLPEGSILTGTHPDGSTFIFSSQAGDRIDDGTVTFTAASIPVATPGVINIPADPAPRGLRTGQTLNMSDGANLGNNFAAIGSTLNIAGGTTGRNIEVVDTVVTISGGTVGDLFTAFAGSTININGGEVGEALLAFAGSEVNITGGQVGDRLTAYSGSTVNITGGQVGNQFNAQPGSMVNITGGSVGYKFNAFADSEINISGGDVGVIFNARPGSTVNISGGEFFLDGVLVPDLDMVGDTVPLNIPSGSNLTVTLTDGTVRAFGAVRFDGIADGTLNLTRTQLPTAAAVVNVPADPAPQGLRIGQTLNLDDGGQLEENFTTTVGSVVNINGGSVGNGLLAGIDSTINIRGGSAGDFFTTLGGSTISISGGVVGRNFNANAGSTVSISGGEVGSGFDANDDSTVNISGGTVGSGFDAKTGSTVNISGGSIGSDFDAEAGSIIILGGLSFILDGVDLTPGLVIDGFFPIHDRNVVLEGVLADGSPFSFDLKDSNSNLSHDFFHPNAALLITLVPEPGALALLGLGGLVLLERRRDR